jgi:Bacteriophage holin of superfamily 6 (Holin_LLH)
MENAVAQITSIAIQTLAPILLALSGWLAHRLIKAFESKTKIDVPVKQEAQVDAWIEAGIHYAEEKAHQAAKSATAKITGPEKLEAAASFALDLAEKNGWIEWTRERLKAKIEAALNSERGG